MKRVSIFISIILLIAIGIVGVLIILEKNGAKIINAVTVSPLSKIGLVFPSNSDFQFYSTLKPSTTFEDRGPWKGAESIIYTFNSDGLNERYNYLESKPENVYRIITLGDSYAFGQFIATKDNWSEKLEDKLNNNKICTKINKFEVINLGMRGFDVPYIVKRFKDFGLKYDPDLIVWLESGSGITRYNELEQPYGIECEKRVGKETAKADSAATYYPCWAEAEKKVLEGKTQSEIEKLFTPWFTQFYKLRGDTPVIFAAFSNMNPNDKQIMRDRIKRRNNAFVMDNILNLKTNGGIFPDGHPNLKGQTIMSNDIFNYILEHKNYLMKCD